MKENLFEAFARMCRSYKGCQKECEIERRINDLKITCRAFIVEHPKEAEEIVTSWVEKHPIKTRQDIFLEQYPNAQLDIKGILMIDPCCLDKSMVTDKCFKIKDCFTCSKEYWEKEV